MIRLLLAALIALQPAQAIACSCIPAEDLSPQELGKTLRQYPLIVRAKIASTDYPAACRVAALRWFTTLFRDREIEVRHNLVVTSSIKGKAAKRLTVVQKQWVDYAGCVAPSEVSCEITVKATDDLWILKPTGPATFERAGWCSSMIIVDTLAKK